MKENWWFAVLPDIQLGRKWININFWDNIYFWLKGIPTKPPEAVVGEEITERLRTAVAWLNVQNLEAERLKRTMEWLNVRNFEFIATVGDLTDSAIKEQFREVSEILSELKKPFIPIWGNHDVWPYEFGPDKKTIWEAIRPLHYREFEQYFQEWKSSLCFQNIREQRQGYWLQNYSFVVNGVKFITVDNNSRTHAPFGLPGQDGVVRLYKESEEWLRGEVLNSREEKIIILSHGPLKEKTLKQIHRLETDKEILAIAGHRHKRSEWRWRNIRRVITNALYHEPYLLVVKIGEEGIKTEYHRIYRI